MSNFQLSRAETEKKVKEVFSTDAKFCYSLSEAKGMVPYIVGDGISPRDCLMLIREKKATNLLQNSIQCLTDKLNFLKLIDYNYEDFFQESLQFIDAEIICKNFDHSADRSAVIQSAFHDAFLEIDMTKYQYIYQVAAELVMNAQIDAPTMSENLHVSQSSLIVEKNISKGLVAISVIDRYGSLNCYKMLENIYAAHRDGFRNAMSKNSVGAGLGSALIYEYADSLFIGAKPDEVSRVTAILPYGLSEKRVHQMQKSIHIIKE